MENLGTMVYYLISTSRGMKRLKQFMDVKYSKLKKFYAKWRVFMWKAVLMRMHSPIITLFEIILPIVFCLQIRLMFEPLALSVQDLDRHDSEEILSKFPKHVECWYAPRNSFVDELMGRASKKLRITMQPADSEIDLIKSHYSKNETKPVLWSIVEIENSSMKPKILKYKIRSSEIGESRMIMMHEEEPANEDPYVLSGFIAFQVAIESSFVEMWKDETLPTVGSHITIGRFPFYNVDFLIMPSVIRPSISVIYYMTVVAFFLLPVATLYKVIHDKETGLRGLMTLMNMTFGVLYVGWLNHLMITVLPVTIVCAILLHPVFSNTCGLMITVFILTYIIVSALFMFAVGTFFSHVTKSLMTSMFFWLFLAHFTIVLDQSLVSAPIIWRITSLALPHSGLLYGLVSFTSRSDLGDYRGEALKNIIRNTRSQQYNSSLSYKWSKRFSEFLMLRDAYDILHTKDKISIGLILIAWIFHIIFWYLLAVYMDNISPGQFGSAKPWYYLCKKTPPVQNPKLVFRGSTNWSAVEQTPFFIKPLIAVRCIKKKFGRFGERITAVNDVTIDFYRQEFTAILGHNGAGKSCLLKTIVGMYRPTQGYVHIKGKEQSEDESTANLIGYCPQENILVNYMTTVQHLYMFGMMRGMPYREAYTEALSLLKRLSLESVKDSKVKSCSFGTQRKVCLAMALIGNTQILVLDEPTYGIDPEHRRRIWNLLSDIKREKTILMATNSMEAADILADRIAIIANGRIECYGSKMYLNRRYGIGYILNVLVHDTCDLEELRANIQEFSAEPINLQSTMGMMVRFDIPRNSRFTRLLQYLESNKEELDIVSVTLSTASIEGQFLRIGLASQFKERSVFYPAAKYELLIEKRRRHLLQSGKPWKRLSKSALRNQQICAMCYKKFLHVFSAWKLYVFSISLAIITLTLMIMVSQLSNYSLFLSTERVMNLTNYVDNNLHVLYYAANEKPATDFLVKLYTTGQLYSDRNNYHISKNVTATDLMIHPNLHSIELRDRYVMSIDVLSDGYIDVMYSSTAVHSGPIALNLLHNALLRYHCGSNDCSIKLTSRPLVKPKQWQHLLIHPRSVRNWENCAIAITIFLLLPTIDLGIRELCSLSKLLQTNTLGVTTLKYWLPLYFVDLFIYGSCIFFLLLIILLAFYGTVHFSNVEILQVYLIAISYGACAIPMGYCVQFITRKVEKVYLTVISINVLVVFLLNGSVIFPLVFRTLGKRGRYFIEVLLHALPPYVFTCALSNYIMLNLYNRQCNYFNTCQTEYRVEDPCCQNCHDKRCFVPLDIMFIKQSGAEYQHSVVDDILLLISQTFVFHIILEVFEEKNRRKWYTFFVPPPKDTDTVVPEVIEERRKVQEYMQHYVENKVLPVEVALVVENLGKVYNGQPVVQGVNFCIYRQECFGLLGFHGSGKSTIYKILTGQTRMTQGKLVLFDNEFTRDQDMFIGMIGYCPQTGGLTSFLTGRQYLQFYAALRGIPYENITDEVDRWLDVLDFENLRIDRCPWGVQRKFCVLQSLIGDLPMILMDDPSSGIDVMTRHAICDMLHQVREMGRSLLITTHNMREAEAMCLRVGVLASGQFMAIGSCEQLKEKHGRNFIMSIKVTSKFQLEHLEHVKSIIDETFPGITFKERHLGILKYELDANIPHSNVFDKLEKLREKYHWITDFSLNQPSMDQVFLDVAKEQKEVTAKVPLYLRFFFWLNNFMRKT